MNEERLKELEEVTKTSNFGLKNRDALALINRVRELERALEQAVQCGWPRLPKPGDVDLLMDNPIPWDAHGVVRSGDEIDRNVIMPDLRKWLEEKL